MPQLDVSTYPSQLVWLALTFVALYLVLALVAIPRVGGVIEERQRCIDEDLERATQLKADAETAMRTYEKAMIDARNGARDVLRQAADAVAAEAERRQKALGAKLAEQIKAGEERIAQAKRAALAEVQTVAADVARTAVARVADFSVDESRAKAAVQAAQTAGGGQ